MRSVFVLALATSVAIVSSGCDDSSSGSGAGAAPSASAAAAGSAALTAASASAAPRAVEKKLITTTAKSPEAKAAVTKGWDLYDNFRRQEALIECKKAVAADADLALGHACVGWLTDGIAGQTDLDKAVELAAKLPDAEKTLIEALSASRHLDIAKYVADVKKVAELAPDDYRSHVWAGRAFMLKREFPAAEGAFKKALELNPGASFVYTGLSRSQTQQKKYDDALASAKKYAEASPKEAAAHQALAAALLNLDKKKEAEEALLKAVELGPKVLSAYNDLANVKALLGDFAGAKETLEKSKAADGQPDDAVDRGDNLAWLALVEGKDADGFKLLETTEKDAEKDKLPAAWHPVMARARALWVLGKAADSLKAADAGFGKCDARAESSAIEKGVCRLGFLGIKSFAQVSLGKVADAQKTLAEIKEDAKKLPDVASVQVSAGLLADQLAAMEKKDTKAAAGLFAKVLPDDYFWKLAVLRMAEKDGDKATVEVVRKDLLGRPINDIGYALVAKVSKGK